MTGHADQQPAPACTTGDLDGLLAILDPDVADVGGRVGIVTVTGRVAVARQTLRFLGPDSSTTLLSLPAGDEAGIVALRDGQIVTLIALTVRDGRVDRIDGIADPIKLAPIARALGTRQPHPAPASTGQHGQRRRIRLGRQRQHSALALQRLPVL